MQINRQNYEQYFLLYADGELSRSERNAVQQFVTENKDLAIELEMIQATILPKEEIKLLDKNFLYKGVDKKTEEQLLLKLDNELPIKELAAIDALIHNDSTVKASYELLTKTTLDKNETIIFEHKNLLYKKEKDNVVPFGYLRWAAAAMLIGVALFTGVKMYNNKNNIEPSMVDAGQQNKKENNIQSPIEIKNNTNNKTSTKNIAQNNNAATTPTQSITNNTININSENNFVEPSQKNVNPKNIVTNNNNQRITNKNEENNISNNQNNFITKEDVIIPPINTTTAQVNPTAIAKNTSVETKVNTERLYELENTYAYQNVVLKEEENTENKIFYMDESKVKKSKVGMFFKRIKTAVQKTAKVKPGNSLQVAGFEISGN
jgi:hypothetical protein